eukprot:jgi/Tetstr1/423134/TSEL_013903.t1
MADESAPSDEAASALSSGHQAQDPEEISCEQGLLLALPLACCAALGPGPCVASTAPRCCVAPMLIFVAHNGKTLELDVQPTTRVDAVQHALAALSGIPAQDQIITCNGARLDPSKPLSSYELPAPAGKAPALEASTSKQAETKGAPEVFLYSRAMLRSDSQAPLAEQVADICVEEPPEPQGAPCPHPLDDLSLAPALRALPARERGFKHHLAVAQALWVASQDRYRTCQRLLSEQEVQSMAIDAARANVEVHYSYICKVFSAFMEKYTALQQAQRDVLLGFERDMEQLGATELHPAAQADGRRLLVDLIPKERLREWADNCRIAREAFAVKVADLEAIFAALRSEVESLFMTAPSVDLDELGKRMEEAHGQLDMEASVLQCLEKDFSTVQKLVEDTVRQMASRRADAIEPTDTCVAVDSMNHSHLIDLLPQIRSCDAQLAAFMGNCVECKSQMTADVVQQLRQISAMQSRIRDMRNKLAVFQEVAGKQGELFAELCLVSRVPNAYRACLAEVVRRRAFSELFANQAAQLAERMAALREKEVGRADAFRAHVERYIPADLQASLGLTVPPPLCEVNIPRQGGGLPEVSMADVQALPKESRPSALVADVFRAWLPAEGRRPPSSPGKPPAPPSEAPGQGAPHEAAAEATVESLQLANARLRADLAAHKATAYLQSLKADPLAGWPVPRPAAATAPASPRGKPPVSPRGGAPPPAKEAAAGAAAGSGEGPDRREAAFSEALSAKDALIAGLEAQLQQHRAQLEAYESRIARMEAIMGEQAASGGRPASETEPAAADDPASSSPDDPTSSSPDDRAPSSPPLSSPSLADAPATDHRLPAVGPAGAEGGSASPAREAATPEEAAPAGSCGGGEPEEVSAPSDGVLEPEEASLGGRTGDISGQAAEAAEAADGEATGAASLRADPSSAEAVEGTGGHAEEGAGDAGGDTAATSGVDEAADAGADSGAPVGDVDEAAAAAEPAEEPPGAEEEAGGAAEADRTEAPGAAEAEADGAGVAAPIAAQPEGAAATAAATHPLAERYRPPAAAAHVADMGASGQRSVHRTDGAGEEEAEAGGLDEAGAGAC